MIRRWFWLGGLSDAWWRDLDRSEWRQGWEGPSWNWKLWLNR